MDTEDKDGVGSLAWDAGARLRDDSPTSLGGILALAPEIPGSCQRQLVAPRGQGRGVGVGGRTKGGATAHPEGWAGVRLQPCLAWRRTREAAPQGRSGSTGGGVSEPVGRPEHGSRDEPHLAEERKQSRSAPVGQAQGLCTCSSRCLDHCPQTPQGSSLHLLVPSDKFSVRPLLNLK